MLIRLRLSTPSDMQHTWDETTKKRIRVYEEESSSSLPDPRPTARPRDDHRRISSNTHTEDRSRILPYFQNTALQGISEAPRAPSTINHTMIHAAIASFSTPSQQPRLTQLDQYLLASRGLSPGMLQQWQLDPRLSQVASRSLSAQDANYHAALLSQNRLALLGLNSMPGTTPLANAHSNLAMGTSSATNQLISAHPPRCHQSLKSSGLSFQRTGLGSLDVPSSSLFLRLQDRGPGAHKSVEPSNMTMGKGGSAANSTTIRPTPLAFLQLPRDDEESTKIYTQRVCVPLASDEDQNWLSEFLCFVRSDLVEIFRANREDVRSRNSSKKVLHGQVGIRCKYCAHLPQSVRASRSSSYPSSLSRIYQSLTMMLRDHFGGCNAIPAELKQRFLELKGKTSQGATDSKHYWVYSAQKLGLIDSDSGIWVRESSEVGEEAPFGTTAKAEPLQKPGICSAELVASMDRELVSDFLYQVMTHAQLVHLEESERNGNRKSLPVGLPGLGCRHCYQSNRKGLCRLFPARRRTLASKVNDLYEHIRRCTLCPEEVKEHLALLKRLDASQEQRTIGEKEFFDRIWDRMGHKSRDEES